MALRSHAHGHRLVSTSFFVLGFFFFFIQMVLFHPAVPSSSVADASVLFAHGAYYMGMNE